MDQILKGVCIAGPFDGITASHNHQLLLLRSKSKIDTRQVEAAYLWRDNHWKLDANLTLDFKKGLLEGYQIIELGENYE